MASERERRSEDVIRADIAREREQLASALADLREGAAAKRGAAVTAGTAVVVVGAALVAARIVRRLG